MVYRMKHMRDASMSALLFVCTGESGLGGIDTNWKHSFGLDLQTQFPVR